MSSKVSKFVRIALAASIAASGAIATTAFTTTVAQAATSSVDGQITRSEIISRAQYWLDKGLQYNQGGNYTDSSGRNYRTDCSGYVSMAWHLGTNPNPSTRELPGYAHEISRADLKAGDILNSFNDHVILFDKWDDAAHTTFSYYSFGSTPVKHRTGISINAATFDSHPNGDYKALRYNKVIDDTATRTGVYHPQTQVFYEGNNAGGTVGSAMFGNPGWKPLTGNWDGVGSASVGAYDAATGTFYLSNDNASAAVSVKFGNPNWVPISGDWNGDGKDSIGAYDPSTSKFYLSNDNSTLATSFVYGSPGDLPVAGDWNGDGADEVGVYHPANQTFYLGDISGGTYAVTTFGNPGWLPVVGDWDANGTSTVGAYDPATSKFYLSNDNLNAATSFVYGSPGDVPITGAW
ncbi:VCBS repeat-containing protein [Kitasatospora sp. NBC_00070]|uniref:VCBS repeat-containing protein n=1 Tax=Kitasatospora sp. NBC_00070 TaxID=2975962 RepID=UPI003252B2BB